MAKVLFVNHASVGHLSTLLNIAVAMKEEGRAVRFMMPGAGGLPRLQIFAVASAVPEMVRRAGLPVETMPPTLPLLLNAARLPGKTGHAETRHAVGLSATSLEHFAGCLTASIARDRPDVIVTDFGFLASSVAADAAGIPYATVFHSGLPFRGEGIPPFGSGLPIGLRTPLWEKYEVLEKQMLEKMDGRVNAARRRFGLSDMEPGILRRPYSPWLNLITSVPEIEAPRGNLTLQTRFVGPCFGKGKMIAGDFPFAELRADKTKIYVSLGTVFNNKPAIFRTLMRGLDDPAYQVVIAAGGAYEMLRREGVPENVLLHQRVPQVELLPKVDLVIGHGGNNSPNESIAAGKPLIVLPVGGEQGDNARRVEWLGIGRRLDLADLREDDVRIAARSVLEDTTVCVKCGELQAAVSRSGGVHEAARLINALAGDVGGTMPSSRHGGNDR